MDINLTTMQVLALSVLMPLRGGHGASQCRFLHYFHRFHLDDDSVVAVLEDSEAHAADVSKDL